MSCLVDAFCGARSILSAMLAFSGSFEWFRPLPMGRNVLVTNLVKACFLLVWINRLSLDDQIVELLSSARWAGQQMHWLLRQA
mgnify:CR=1 FL=1